MVLVSHCWFSRLVLPCIASFLSIALVFAANELPDLPGATNGTARSQGIYRFPNLTIQVPRVPGGFRYTTDVAYPMVFKEPVGFAVPPGETNRLFVLEKPGRIITVTNLAKPNRTVFLDISDRVFHEQESGLLGLAFHPNFAANGRFFVTYTFSSNGSFDGVNFRLSRFTRSPLNPNIALPDTELPLFTQFDGDPWHEGGDLRFGPDGYLYISMGDGGQLGFQNVQRIDRFLFGGILRIDVDKRPGNLAPNPHPGGMVNYSIPADNPFVGASAFNGVPVDMGRLRSEFYAVGLRNPWRFSFDSSTGDLYSNDTGSSFREEVNLILKGANYGWPFTEGSLTHTNLLAAGLKPKNLLPPLAEYGYEGGGSGTGKAIAAGLLYRGAKYPGLDGAYLFSDFWTGDIGLIRPESNTLPADLRSAQTDIDEKEARLTEMSSEMEERQAAWERDWARKDRSWTVLSSLESSSASGAELVQKPDNSLLAVGDLAFTETYTVVARTELSNLRAVRLELLPDDTLPGRGPGRAAAGNVVISEFEISIAPQNDLASIQSVRLINPMANYSQVGWEVDQAIDRNLSNGWAIAPAMGLAHEAVFEFETPVGFSAGTVLGIVIKQRLGSQVTLGRFRLSVSSATPPIRADAFPNASEILRIPIGSRSSEQKARLAAYYRALDPEAQHIRLEIESLREKQIRAIDHRAAEIEWIASQPGIASFGIDPRNGDILLADMLDGVIRKLRLQIDDVSDWPPSLADTGLFSDLASLTPATGVVPYSVNLPFWSDNALKRRWFSVPDPKQTIGFNSNTGWEFPRGTVWVKHFDLEITNGVPSSARRLETRVLVRHAHGVHGATYRWNAAGRKAALVPDGGESETILTYYGGAVRPQLWRYPSRTQCLQCHTSVGGFALGFNTVQLNRQLNYDGFSQNQIEALSRAGYLDKTDIKSDTLPVLADPASFYASREFRVRSFLHANCVHCHQPGGPGRSNWDARITTQRSRTGLIDGLPAHRSNSPMDRLVKPGSLEHSVLWQRLAKLGDGHMPPLGTDLVNAEALDLIGGWITQDLPFYETYDQWRARRIPINSPWATHPLTDLDRDGMANFAEYLFGTNPLLSSDALKLTIKRSVDVTTLEFPWPANVGMQIQWSDNASDPLSWLPLEVPGNRPFFLSFPAVGLIEDYSANGASRFYRLIVREP